MSAARRAGVVGFLAPVLVVLLAFSALAFWTTTGAGSGSATAAATWTETIAPVVAFSSANAGNGHRQVFVGTTTIKTGTLTVNVYAGATATGTAVRTYTAAITQTGSSPYGWSVTTGNGDLHAGTQYTARATHVDGTSTGNQPTKTFTAA